MVLAWVVRSVGTTFCPEELEETLRFAALEPLETHIVRFRCLGLHGAHGQTVGGVIVGCYGRGIRLRMSHFFQRVSVWNRAFATVVKCTEFGF